MPLKNVELIPVKCPNCGSNMDVPQDLKTVHCMYCGAKFLLSEKTKEIHYHISKNNNNVNNYLRLSIDKLKEGNVKDFENYLDKAKEINYEYTQNIIEKNRRDLVIKLIDICNEEINKIINKGPLDIIDLSNADLVTISLFASPIIANQKKLESDIKSNVINIEHKEIINKFNYVYSILERMADNNKIYLSELYFVEGKFYIANKILFSKSRDKSKLYQSKAINSFIKSYQYNYNNKNNNNYLKKYGYSCIECDGTGICCDCEGKGICYDCEGSNKCYHCNGTGIKPSLFNKNKKCSECQGTGTCIRCKGNYYCSECNGEKICNNCKGTGVIVF